MHLTKLMQSWWTVYECTIVRPISYDRPMSLAVVTFIVLYQHPRHLMRAEHKTNSMLAPILATCCRYTTSTVQRNSTASLENKINSHRLDKPFSMLSCIGPFKERNVTFHVPPVMPSCQATETVPSSSAVVNDVRRTSSYCHYHM